MKCTYITNFFDKKNQELFLCHLGERAGIFPEDISWIVLSNLSPVSEDVWNIIIAEERVIIDLTKLNMEILIILYARYLKWPSRTFLLLSAEQEREFRWGYGASIYERSRSNNLDKYQLARLQRDIAFYFGQDTGEPMEPVRGFLERYWLKEQIKKLNCNTTEIDFDNIEIYEENTGEEIIKRLKKCLAQGDIRGFQNELRNIAYNKNIDPMDYIIIGRLCSDAGLVTSQVAVLKQGNKVWKSKNMELLFELIDAYIDSPNVENREEGLKLAEQLFHIRYNEKKELIWDIEEMDLIITQNYLKSLFNAYISLNAYKELYAVACYEEQVIKKANDYRMNLLFMRNKAVCLGEMGNYTDSLKLCSKLLLKSQNEDSLKLMMMTCEKAGKYVSMLDFLTVLVWINYGDMKYFAKMAEIIIEHSIIYNVNKGWQEVAQFTKSAEKQAVPLLMYVFSFEENQRKRALIYDVDKILKTINSQSEEFLLRNKDKVAYLWTAFKKECGSTYDFDLVNFLNINYKAINLEKSKIQKYIDKAVEDLYLESENEKCQG